MPISDRQVSPIVIAEPIIPSDVENPYRNVVIERVEMPVFGDPFGNFPNPRAFLKYDSSQKRA